MKNLTNLNITPFTNEEVIKLIKLYQFKGKDFYYQNVMSADLESIIKQTVEIDCYEMAKYLNLDITDNRKNLIIKKDSTPKTNDEKTLKNLKSIFQRIQADAHNFEFLTNDVLSLGKLLSKGISDCSFNRVAIKKQVNIITESTSKSKRDELETLLKTCESLINKEEYELTYLITNFYIDFINDKYFNINNDVLGLILLYLLLFREDFHLFKYVSFAKLLNSHLEEFKINVNKANYNYEEGFSKTAPLQKLIIDMMLEGYDMVETKAREYSFDSSLNKSDNIENTIYKLPQIFTKDDIRLRHPYTSESTINRTLQRLRDENKIRPNGVGRSASWIRLVELPDFNPDYKQMDIFNELGDKNTEKQDKKEEHNGFDFGL